MLGELPDGEPDAPAAAPPVLPELEPLAGGVLLEPLEALLDGAGELGVVLAEPLALDEPPEAESFFVASADEEELEDDGGVLGAAPAELEDDEGGVLGFTLTEPEVELEPDGAVDGVVEPADEDDDAPGWVLVVAERSSPQPVSIPAPSARETATAKVESLMLWASLVGVSVRKQGARLTR